MTEELRTSTTTIGNHPEQPKPYALSRSSGVGGGLVHGLKMRGNWLFLHRKLKNSPIAKDGVTLAVFVQLMINAVYKTTHKPLYGYTLDPGDCDLTLKQLSELTGFTIAQVRGSLNRLQRNNTIVSIKLTQRRRAIRLVNWDLYQHNPESNTEPNTEPSSELTPKAAPLKDSEEYQEGGKMITPPPVDAPDKQIADWNVEMYFMRAHVNGIDVDESHREKYTAMVVRWLEKYPKQCKEGDQTNTPFIWMIQTAKYIVRAMDPDHARYAGERVHAALMQMQQVRPWIVLKKAKQKAEEAEGRE